VIDYGHDGGAGDTLQAIRDGRPASPFEAPGAADLTAHVDFAALARAAGPLRVSGPVGQGVWLARLGIEARAEQLKSRATPIQRAAIDAALVRLTSPGQMGALFKAMALSAPQWPAPAGFDA
jgi:SAM-dependent MidA family methyltransferase